MLFKKSLWFVCCTTSLLMAVNAIPYGPPSPVELEAPNNIKQVLPRRQAQPWRNETKSATQYATTSLVSSISPEVRSSSLKEPTTIVSRSESAISIARTSTPSSSYTTLILSPSVLKPSVTTRESPFLTIIHTISDISTQISASSSQASQIPGASRQDVSSSLQLSLKQESMTSVSASNTIPSGIQHESTLIPTTTLSPSSGGNRPHTTKQVSISSFPTSVLDAQNSSPSPSGVAFESQIISFGPRPSSILLSINPSSQATSSQTTSLLAVIPTQLESSISYGAPVYLASSTSTLHVEPLQSTTVTSLQITTEATLPESSKLEHSPLFTATPIATSVSAALSWSSTPVRVDSSPTTLMSATESPFVVSYSPSAPTTRHSLVTITFPSVSLGAVVPLSSSTAIIPASESTGQLSPDTTLKPASTLASMIPSGSLFPSASATTVINTPTVAAQSSAITQSERSTQTLVTTSPSPESVTISTYRASSAILASPSIGDIRSPVLNTSSSYNYTTATNASPFTVLETPASATLTSRQDGSGSLSTVPTTSSLLRVGTGSAASPTYYPTTTQHGWNKTSSFLLAASSTGFAPTIVATGVLSNSNATRSSVALPPHLPSWSNTTSTYPVANVTSAIGAASQIPNASSTIDLDTSMTLVVTSVKSSTGPAIPVSPTRVSTSSASATAAAAPTPPLTTSQTAGVAIAGTTGLLIAIVAAVFMARRYHARKARRSSTGSVYPKVAYLYDPPAGESDDEDRTHMSGGMSGIAVQESTSRAPPNSPQHSQRYSTGMLPMRYSDPGNPFRDLEDPTRHSNGRSNETPAGAAAALSAAIRGYRATSQSSSNLATLPDDATYCDVGYGSSKHDHKNIGDLSPGRSSILSEITSMAYSSHPLPNAATLRYQPLSPYGYHQNHSLPCVRETMYTDPFRDPFEHDLLLQVDTRTETPDFVTVYAPTPPATVTKPIKLLSKNPWASSLLTPVTTQATLRTHSRLTEESLISPDATIVASERFSLAYDNKSSTTYIAPSQNQPHNTMSPISPSTEPTHRGWDDIKRYSADKVVPSSVISICPPLRHDSPPPLKKKSLPHLRRKEVALSMSPSSVKIPFTHHKNLSVDGHKFSPSAKLDPAGHGDGDYVRSADSHISHGVQSLVSLVHKKKSADLDFACAGV